MVVLMQTNTGQEPQKMRSESAFTQSLVTIQRLKAIERLLYPSRTRPQSSPLMPDKHRARTYRLHAREWQPDTLPDHHEQFSRYSRS